MSLSSFNAFALTRSEMKNVIGVDCGIKIGGTWYHVGNKSTAKSYVGQTTNWYVSNGSGGFKQVTSGTATSYCCQQCSWN
jgi:hypothetical protein